MNYYIYNSILLQIFYFHFTLNQILFILVFLSNMIGYSQEINWYSGCYIFMDTKIITILEIILYIVKCPHSLTEPLNTLLSTAF